LVRNYREPLFSPQIHLEKAQIEGAMPWFFAQFIEIRIVKKEKPASGQNQA
jgi:hypothetical protein